MRKRGARRLPTRRAWIWKAPATGPAVAGFTDTTTGFGAVVSTLNAPGIVTVRPVRRSPTCRR